MAEVAWTDPDKRNLADFRRRVTATKRYLGSLGVDYYDKNKCYGDYDLTDGDNIPNSDKVKERSKQLKEWKNCKEVTK